MGNDERTRLKTLLKYWLEHNEEHRQEYNDWAAQATAMGETEAGEDILAAAQDLDKASQSLSQALKRLG